VEGRLKFNEKIASGVAYGILNKLKADRKAPSSPNDFSLKLDGHALEENENLIFSPYCIDFAKSRVLEVGLPKDFSFGGPFFYLDQYENALAVRFKDFLDYISTSHAKVESPLFIFSIGRAGSTLASQLLSYSHFRSISEPDVLLQMGDDSPRQRKYFQDEDWGILYERILSSLADASIDGKRLAIKYRAQSSNVFHVSRLHRLRPDAQFVFLFRNPRSWAESFSSTFDFSFDTLRWLYSENIESCSMLKRAGASCEAFNYEAIEKNPIEFLRRVSGDKLGLIAESKFYDTLSEDSQRGLFLDRGNYNPVEVSKFMLWWNANVSNFPNLGFDWSFSGDFE